MSARTELREVDGQQVTLADCDWVLWSPCGCPQGVTVGRYSATEDDAWKSFYEGRWKDIAHAVRRGERMELMTHDRWCREVADRMRQGCTHAAGGVTT